MNIQEKVWKVGMWVGILLAVFLAVISIKEFKAIGYVGKDTPVFNSISVSGKGEEVSIPDVATFSFGVTETNKQVAVAQEAATKRINAALAALEEAGIAEKDIKTTSYSINPNYEYTQGVCTMYSCPPSKSVLIGYEVSQNIDVKIRDIAKAGEVFSTIGALGVDTVNNLAFSIDDIETVKAKARAKAIADAQTKAKELSKQLGVRIVRITSFYDSSDDMNPYYYGRGGDMMEASAVKNAAAPMIPTGEQEIVSRVTVTYEIK
ncbi:MAG: SIMPL domain-containing protein [Patescibacteria group bacterium]